MWNMNIPSENIQNDAYKAIGEWAKSTFPSFSWSVMKDIQATLTADLKQQGIDFNSLSPEKKHATLNKFLETHYEHDKAILSDNVKRWSVVKENYFLDEILGDGSLSSYIDKVQGNIPFAQGIIRTILDKVAALDSLPEGFKKEVDILLERHKSKPLSSIDIFRTQYKDIIDKYDPDINSKASELGALTIEQKKQLADISIDNGSILESLKESWDISDEDYTTIKDKDYKERPEDWKKVWATNLRKQFAHSYMDVEKHTQWVWEGMQSLVKMPTIENVFTHYADKIYPGDSKTKYNDLLKKHRPNIQFENRSKEEKQSLLDTMVEKCYIPNIQKFSEKLWLNTAQYESFVKQLFSLDAKELTIPWLGGNQIKLKFLKKDISGSIPVHKLGKNAYDRLTDILPLDFVLDGSDSQEMQKLASVMPGKDRNTVNGSRYDPKQQLSMQVNGQTVTGYAYKIMHNGEEKTLITQEYVPARKHNGHTQVLWKDGQFVPLPNATDEKNVVIIQNTKNDTDDAYKIGPKEPIVYSMQPHDVQWLLTAYCLNNSTNISDEDKSKLFAPVPKPQALTEFFADEILGKDEDTQKSIDDQKNYSDEELSLSRESAMKTRDNMLGVKNTKFEKWTQFAIQNVDSIFTDIPGNGWYMMLEITDADDRQNPTKFKYKILGWVETDITSWWSSLGWQESNRLPFSDEFFGKLKDYGNGALYKFPPKHTEKKFLDYAKDLSFGNTGMDQLGSRFGLLTQNGNDLVNNAQDTIKYFGVDIVQYDDKGTDTNSYAMFETTFSGDSVKIKDKSWAYSRTMSFPAFLIFAADKGLHAYSEKEYQAAVGPEESSNAGRKTAFFVMSPMNIIDGVKKRYTGTITEWVKKSNERRVEKVEEMFYTSGLTNALGAMPIWWEYFVQAQDSYDGKLADKHHKIIMEWDSTINQRWKKLVRGKQTYIDNHNLKWVWRESCFNKIIEIFDKVDQGKPLDDVERREWFAGLLYILEKFQTPYPRKLAKYAGKQLWPRMLLNDDKYEEYMRWFNDAKLKLETGQARGEDVRELMDNVMHYDVKNMSELMKNGPHRFIYGYKSIPVLQEHSEKRTNDTARKDGLTAAGHHPAFGRAYQEEVKIKLNFGQYGYAIGWLIQLSKRKEISDPANYRRWLTGVLQVILSWGMRYAANRSDRKYLRDFLRKHGFPISDYILDNAQGAKDLATLLDVISAKAGCEKTFSQATGWSEKLEKYGSWSENKKPTDDRYLGAHAEFNGSMDKWFLWGRNAEKVIPFLQNSNLDQDINLATIAKDPSLTHDQREIIERYLKVSLNAHPARDFDSYKWWEDFVNNLIQDRTVFNVSRQLMQDEYMKYSNGTFGGNEEMVWYFWKALENQFAGYARKDTLPKQSLELILTKYYSLFQWSYSGDHQRFLAMLAYMKNEKDPKKRKRYAKAAITNYIKKNNGYSAFPAIMSSALAEVENFFVNHVDAIDDDMVSRLIKFDELEATTDQRKEALQVYTMMKPSDAKTAHPKQNEAVQKYIADLATGKISWWSKWFTFDELRLDSGGSNDDEEWFLAQEAGIQAAEQASQDQKAAADQEEQAKQADQKKQEEERKKKEQEESEAKKRQEESEAKKRQEEEEAKKNNPKP